MVDGRRGGGAVNDGGWAAGARARRGVACGAALLVLSVSFIGCGNTRRTPSSDAGGTSGQDSSPAPLAGTFGTGGTSTAGSGTGGVPFGGASVGGASVGGASDGGAAGDRGGPECIDGAPCTCDDGVGILKCEANDASDAAYCSCPPADTCDAPSTSCFEPCGGPALGLWVLEETCLPGAKGGHCADAAVEGSSPVGNLKLEVLENEPILLFGTQSLDLRAKVPLECLGIESVNRCRDAEFYSFPFFSGSSTSLSCEANDCGYCECAGTAHGGGAYGGSPWKPGSMTLALGAYNVPYCVQGDTLWLGGSVVAGDRKVSYKFRRRSCVGTPAPCAERDQEICDLTQECIPGQCLPNAGTAAADCDGLAQESCDYLPECHWVGEGCWGTATLPCQYRFCESTPGCEWGEPTARCGGQIRDCFLRDNASCDAPGCSVRTCDVPDGWSGVDGASCEPLDASECSMAAGCALVNGKCTGKTLCATQTNPALCTKLTCQAYPAPHCGGLTTMACSDLSVEDCSSQPGCRLEW